MNIPRRFKCPNCGTPRMHRVHLNNPSLRFTCTQCGQTWHEVPSLDQTVGVLILARSGYELEIEKDYDMAIVLAAAALDCELSLLYCKWKGFEANRASASFTPEVCEEELRCLANIVNKIKKVSGMMYEGGIEAFVANSTEWSETIENRFPSLREGSLAKGFQETVFWPRNGVLHQGSTDHTEAQASTSYSIAELGIRILKDMDKAKLRQEEQDEQAHE